MKTSHKKVKKVKNVISGEKNPKFPTLSAGEPDDTNCMCHSVIDCRTLAKWLKHSRKHCNKTVDKEQQAWQVITDYTKQHPEKPRVSNRGG